MVTWEQLGCLPVVTDALRPMARSRRRAPSTSPQACRPPPHLTHIFPMGPWYTVSSSVTSTPKYYYEIS